MKKFLLFLFLLSFFSTLFSQKHTAESDYYFYENKGQIVNQDGKENVSVKYLFLSNGLNVQLRKEGFSYDVYEVEKSLNKRFKNKKKDPFSHTAPQPEYDYKYRYHRVDIDFVSANKNPEIVAVGKSSDYDNYYNLPHKPKGVEKVHRFQKIIYKNLYDNIDLVFFKPEDTLKPIEYNFIINPGGKISDIQLKLNGAKSQLKDGKVVMNLRFGEMEENIPYSWIEKDQSKDSLLVNYTDLGNNTYGFKSHQDTFDKTVVIDPVPTRIWGSYFGGTGDDYGNIKVDKNNNIYLSGCSSSKTNIATSGSPQSTSAGGFDAYITKISKDGQRFWGTYYGKEYFDTVGSVDFDENFNVYAALLVAKPNARYPGNSFYAYQKIVFLKLNSTGTLLVESVFGKEVGDPTLSQYGSSMQILDVKFFKNKLYVTGDTNLNYFGTAGAFQETTGTVHSGFLAKFDGTTGENHFFTYIGGDGPTSMRSIFNADETGIELSGITRAHDFPMIDAFQQVNNSGNNQSSGLYAKFSEEGTLLKASYLGKTDSYLFLSTRRFGNEVMFTGKSLSINKLCYFIVDTVSNTIKDYKEVGVFQTDGGIYVDDERNIFAAGRASPFDTWINQQATPDAYITNIRYGAAFYTKYDYNFNKIWSTFYVGNGGSQLGMVTKDYEGYLYFWGMSSNNTTGIATPGTFQQRGGHPSNDLYIAKFADCASNAVVSFTPTCINQNLQLNASGGTSYEWFGPNGFTSTLQNPVIKNAQVNDSGEYFVRITGGQSCGGIFSVNVKIGSSTLPVLDVPNLPDINALCSVVITTIPTVTTGCGTSINATTSDPLQYAIAGNYVIMWKYDDGNGNTLSQTQKVIVQKTAAPTFNAAAKFCLRNSPKISDIQISGSAIKWYDAAGNILSSGQFVANGATYFATQTVDGCESEKAMITVTVTNPAFPSGGSQQDFCSAQNPTISNLMVTGSNISWYDAAGLKLTASTPLSDGKTYYATQTVGGCESTQKLAVKVSVANGGIPAGDYSTTFCNDIVSNTKIVNLNDYKTNLIANTSGLTFDFFDSANQSISNPANQKLTVGANVFNVKISNTLGCFVNVKLTLTLNPKPQLNVPQAAEFCSGQTVNLDAGSGFSTYAWSKDNNPTIISASQIFQVSTAGKYMVKVKNDFGCENSASVTVTQSSLGAITGVQIVNNSATIVMSNAGDFLYSLDNVSWQKSNSFTNLSNGNHTALVKTSGGCVIGQMNFTIFNVPNSFTPNDDGINDTWKIDGMENYPNSDIKVYDREGKVILSKITNGTFEWDGTFASRPLPSGSYWYVIKVSDGRILKGWLLIKNRN
jgi:gliding motility-associated-like protein